MLSNLILGFFSLTFVLVSQGHASQTYPPDLLDDPEVQRCFVCVYWAGGSGMQRTEAAAWVYKEGDETKCMFWPFSNESKAQIWPKGAPWPQPLLALVHSHPNGGNVEADDDGDQAAARTINAPNYVVSHGGVWKFDPSKPKKVASFQVADFEFFQRVGKTLPKDFCNKYETAKIQKTKKPKNEN